MTEKQIDEYWNFLNDNEIATDEELRLVTEINGANEKTLNDILFVRTGYRDWKQYMEGEGINSSRKVRTTF